MILYFADNALQIVGMASTGLSDGVRIYDDVKEQDIDTGLTTLSCYVDYTDETREIVRRMVEVGNYIIRTNGDDHGLFSIVQTEDTYPDSTIYLYAEDAGLGLLNVEATAYTATEAKPIAFYVDKHASGAGWEIGLNELSDQSRKLKWEGESTATERIRSIATQFGGEIGYRFEIDGFSVTHKYIDIYEKRGTDTQMELRVGREIKRITELRNIENLVTALKATGGTPEGSQTPITLAGETYDDGDIYLNASGLLMCRSAASRYPRSINDQKYITGTYSYDTTNKTTLRKHAVTELRKRSTPEVTYAVELLYLPSDLHIGDTIRIADKTAENYLSARVLKLSESVDADQITATFGDFLPVSSGISGRIEALAEEIKDLYGRSATYTWVAYADTSTGEGITTDPTGKAYIGLAYNQTSASPDLTDPSVYRWQSVSGGGGGEDSYQLATNATRANLTTTVRAYLIKGTADVTNTFPATSYRWTKVTEDGSTDLGTGYSVSVTAADMGYGGVIRCTFTA